MDSTICFAIFYLSISSAVGTNSTALQVFVPSFGRGGALYLEQQLIIDLFTDTAAMINYI